MSGDDEFVVEVDRDAVPRARAATMRAAAASAWVAVVAGGFVAPLGVAYAHRLLVGDRFGTANGPMALVILGTGAIVVFFGMRRLGTVRRLGAALAAVPVSAVAMRLSAAGLRTGIDAAPDSIFLPWPAIRGFHVTRFRGRELLILDLSPDVTTTPEKLRWAVRILRQPLSELDNALTRHSAGRVRIS